MSSVYLEILLESLLVYHQQHSAFIVRESMKQIPSYKEEELLFFIIDYHG